MKNETKETETTAPTSRPLSTFLVRRRLETLSLEAQIHCYADMLLDLCESDNRINFDRACQTLFPIHSKAGALEGIERLINIINSRAVECGVDLKARLSRPDHTAPDAPRTIWFENLADEGHEEAQHSHCHHCVTPTTEEEDLLERARPVVVFYQNEMMLDWVNGAVVMVDRDGRVTEANNTALNLLGWPLNEFIGRHLHETVHHSEHDGRSYSWEFCPVFAAIQDGSSHHVDGDHFWRRDGSSFVADFIVCPARNENDEIIGAVLILRNLTDQRLREATRIQSMKMESLGVLASGIAHEINTPIQFIGSNLAFLEESFEDFLSLHQSYREFLNEVEAKWPEAADLAGKIRELEEDLDADFLSEEVPSAFKQTSDGVNRVSKLVLGLKGFVHSGDNQSHSATDLNEVISNALIVCQNAYKYVAKLETDFDELPAVDIIPGDIGQVIVNLVVNAAHAIDDKQQDEEKGDSLGLITVATRKNGDKVTITVSDTGQGIPKTIISQIFDPFFTTKEVGRGTGQGLAISRTIIHDKHNGEMTVDSREGEGTTFTISLPIRCSEG